VKYPQATRKDHEKFCVTEGWTKRKTATGKTGTHHVSYEFALPDGRILLTRVSHPVNRETYGARLWSHILRDQLDVTEAEFWGCVQDGDLPDRGGVEAPAAETIPLGVVTALIEQFHVPEAEVRKMSKDEAIKRMIEGYASQSDEP